MPVRVAFDLDPGPPAVIRECCLVALRVRELFGNFGLEIFAKTSGSKGIQVYVPLNGEETYDTSSRFRKRWRKRSKRPSPPWSSRA